MQVIRRFAQLVAAIALATPPALSLPLASALEAEEIRIESAVVTPVEQVDLPARAVGQLVAVEVYDGATVRKGDLIGRVDSVEAELAEKKARGELAIAEAEAANRHRVEATAKAADVARAELKRAVEAGEKYSKSISQTELDRLRLTAEQSELEHREARHDMEVAQLNVDLKRLAVDAARRVIERHELRSPIDGIVVEVRRRPGEWVEPGMTVARIISMDPLRVEGFLDGRRLSRTKVGMRVKFVPASDDPNQGAFYGKLTFVSPEANPVNGQVRVAAIFENTEKRLQPGLHGELMIAVDK